MAKLFTIGYSGMEMDNFIEIIKLNGIDVVCDVRSTPYSQYKPDFSRKSLKSFLNLNSVKYKFMGESLGARPKDRSCYVAGQATYERIANSLFFKEGLDRVRNGVRQLNLALLCSERDPIECHRAILVCRNLADLHSSIYHIHTDGEVESHEHFEERLVNFRGSAPLPLLRQPGDWERAVTTAYKEQGDAIAYRERYPEAVGEKV